MKLSSLVPLALVAVLTPLGCAVDPAGAESDGDFVGTDEGAATFPAGCIVGSTLPARGWDRLPVAERVAAVHSRNGYAFGKTVSVDEHKSSVELTAQGVGAYARTAMLVEDSDYAICGGMLTVAPNARVWIGGLGLTNEQYAACSRNLDQKQCATLAHFCQPGTMYKYQSCVLKTGFTVTANVFRR
jgi:hypothetical protein